MKVMIVGGGGRGGGSGRDGGGCGTGGGGDGGGRGGGTGGGDGDGGGDGGGGDGAAKASTAVCTLETERIGKPSLLEMVTGLDCSRETLDAAVAALAVVMVSKTIVLPALAAT